MRRSPALAPLSRDHHVALEVALRLRRATAESVEAAVERWETYWDEHGARHFEIEERLILGALPSDDGELHDHVRFEERHLFALLEERLPEERLPEEELAVLGRALDAAG